MIAGTIWFVIIGMNMLASVGWDPFQFIRQLFWLALEPPPAKYGLSIPPLNRGRLVHHLERLPAGLGSVCGWARIYVRRARALGLGTHVFWAFGSAIFLFLVLGLFRPLLMGSWAEAVPYGIFPHLDWTAAFSIRYGNLYYNPVPLSLDRLPVWFRSAVCHACGDHSRGHPLRRRAANSSKITDRGTASEPRRPVLEMGTMGFNATMESIHRWAWWFAVLTPITDGHRNLADRNRGRQLCTCWGNEARALSRRYPDMWADRR